MIIKANLLEIMDIMNKHEVRSYLNYRKREIILALRNGRWDFV